MKKDLAERYIELKKQFDGKDFKSGIQAHNVDYLIKEFKTIDLREKIDAVKRALLGRDKI